MVLVFWLIWVGYEIIFYSVVIKIIYCFLYLSRIVKRIYVICIFVILIVNNEVKRNIIIFVEVSYKFCEKIENKGDRE